MRLQGLRKVLETADMKYLAMWTVVKVFLAKFGMVGVELPLKPVTFQWPGALPTWTENQISPLFFPDLVRPRIPV